MNSQDIGLTVSYPLVQKRAALVAMAAEQGESRMWVSPLDGSQDALYHLPQALKNTACKSISLLTRHGCRQG